MLSPKLRTYTFCVIFLLSIPHSFLPLFISVALPSAALTPASIKVFYLRRWFQLPSSSKALPKPTSPNHCRSPDLPWSLSSLMPCSHPSLTNNPHVNTCHSSHCLYTFGPFKEIHSAEHLYFIEKDNYVINIQMNDTDTLNI